MNKKTMAYVLIGVGAIAALYYLYTRFFSGAAAAAALGAGAPDNRGAWAAEDDALYQKFRGMFTVGELNWIDPLVKQAYESGASLKDDVKIQGKISKAGAFASVIYGVIPNPKGTYPAVGYAQTDPATGQKMKSLWSPTVVDTIFNDLAALRVKYGGL